MLNEALRLIRTYHDLTQSQLGLELGVSNSYLSEIEAGKKTPSLDLLGKYSHRFNLPVSSLLFFSEALDKSKKSDRLRVGVAKKVLSLLKWVDSKR
ncbi:transcriptional regulator [Alcaligenes faecalis]|uniref:helix-turn-helix transcriptional regulator n=1 Tax=Alcaligenes faecalis TaxID=511 RepID=UPI000A2DCEFD|nr:helix-turn-helix transcriptional regulator [Alcaligenes faecalis]OSZ33909.1 transcriptional regulator [Alcaligenes faecalis]OSZ43853.1 transcriptional regulator [Alcaligenes faecalis]